MMTTCRLLCALLVLALCCCLSVCVAESDVTQVSEPDLGSNRDEKSEMEGKGLPSSSAGEAGPPGPGQAHDSLKTPVVEAPKAATKEEQGDARGSGSSSEPTKPSANNETGNLNGSDEKPTPQGIQVPGPALPEKPITETPDPNTGQEPGDTGTQEAQSSNNPSTNQRNTNVDNSTETSAPTTINTTRTTTTTTAPEAPSTTTTEAPTTTTTGAPSRLREIDGSLSSSAWVCAPLLLAVSALAYTTLS
ncbi:mucin TcMUCII, putative [Trypanosoma cruzi marinkellei]|uniref:Mucin TcMUCII, putative n=1 Tax=Trypanosoma cruzi marinkellei TaxID=85056 RepID=K2NKL1_TRYCR|nr:mucin TcMUCII, putative [Trypanosoma cruzi marinkellei]